MKNQAQFFCTICFVLLFIACRKDSSTNPTPLPIPPQVPLKIIITDISPLTGRQGDTVIITGSNFNLNVSEDSVKFNGKTAAILKVTSDKILVTVPLTSSGIITVNGIPAPGTAFIYIPSAFVTTFAGGAFTDTLGNYAAGGHLDGPNELALFYNPASICFDKEGNLFVQEFGGIRKISNGYVSTYADYNTTGYQYSSTTTSEFLDLGGIALDAEGVLYVSEMFFGRIRKISDGVLSDFVGTGIPAYVGDPDTITSPLIMPDDIAFDSQGNLFVCENIDIRKISKTGTITGFAGEAAIGLGSFRNGQGLDARFYHPTALAFDATGNIYVADAGNFRIRKITPSGLVSTFAGSGIGGLQDGPSGSARFSGSMNGLCFDKLGNLYVSDWSCIRKITPDGFVSTLAGTPERGFANGSDAQAKFYYPAGMAFDSIGNLYVADFGNQCIRKITFIQ